MKRVTRKRLAWLGAIVTFRGDVHYERYPCPHPWKNCRCLDRRAARIGGSDTA